ncbi:DUF6932 family protein [Nocardia tengchongensis]|uniref:DUF6932 family protein n=1 Tax=Nocardia tengchongensis TaxID=2055889 RepID=UPI0036C4AFB9
MIPEFDQSTGHMPPGRYLCTLDEVHEHLVNAEQFRGSTKRGPLFGNLVTYLADWDETTKRLGFAAPLLRSFWLAGSFASSKLDPGDIDIAPVVDGRLADEARRKPGSRMIRDLTQHREGIKERYGLEVFVLRWSPVVQPHRADV